MKDDTTTILLVVGGLGLVLWYLSTQTPATQANLAIANQNAANLAAANLNANTNMTYANDASNLIQSLANDF